MLKRVFVISFCCVIILNSFLYGASAAPVSTAKQTSKITSTPKPNNTSTLMPKPNSNNSPSPSQSNASSPTSNNKTTTVSSSNKMPDSNSITAKSAILIDSISGKILFEKNSNQRVPIASVTKIITMDIIMDSISSGKIKESDKVKVSPIAESTGGSQVWLKVGEEFTVSELLKSIAIHSANDSCVAMAEFIAGSEAEFVKLMNKKVDELQLKNTKFVDCNGLNDDDQYSTALDVSFMARDLVKNHPEIKKYTMIVSDTFRDGKMDLINTNKMLKNYSGMYGIKTGTTDKAGNCLCAGVDRDGMDIISVALGATTSESRFDDTRKILDYGFNNFEKLELAKKNYAVGEVTVKKTLKSHAEAVCKEDISVIIEKGQGAKIKEDIVFVENLQAPIADGQKVGEKIFKNDKNEEIIRVDLVIAGGRIKITYFDAVKALFSKWIMSKK